MKKIISAAFAVIMLFSVVFVSEAVSANHYSGNAQQVIVKKKRKPGIVRGTYRGGKWVTKKTWNGTKWVSRKVWVGTKWTGKKTWKTGRKVVSRTKKIVY